MSYETIEGLPADVKRVLPKKAQEIYLKAFNSAWEVYRDPRRVRIKDSREVVASRVAWNTVRNKFRKDDVGIWVSKI